MKKILPLITLVIFMSTMLFMARSFAQPFLGLGVTNKGANIQAGVWVNDLELSAGYKVPLVHNDIPSIASILAGYRIGKYLIPSIGVANYRVKDYTEYNADPTGKSAIIQISEIHPLVGLELGLNSYCGRVFAQANYCKGFYFGIGIKMFTNPIQ